MLQDARRVTRDEDSAGHLICEERLRNGGHSGPGGNLIPSK